MKEVIKLNLKGTEEYVSLKGKNLYEVHGFYYYNSEDSRKVNVNKDISCNDWDNEKLLQIIKYYDEYVISKDEEINQYGIEISCKLYNGYAMDFHTIKSVPKEIGPSIKKEGLTFPGRVLSWTSLRTIIGEKLYRLKYRKDKDQITSICTLSNNFLKKLNWNIDVIIPITPSNIDRYIQPVIELSKGISKLSGFPLDLNYLIKKQTSELKGIESPDERQKILENAFSVEDKRFKNKTVLLFDDLFRSGATLNAATKVLKEQGEVGEVLVLTITKTKTKR